MSDPAHARRWNASVGGWTAACLLGVLTISGCGLLFQGPSGSVVDAHVIYRVTPDCAALVARSLRNGYTVMEFVEMVPDDADAPVFEVSGVFEGPVREGESVFRYVSRDESATWQGVSTQVVLNVHAIRLDLPTARARLDDLCAFGADRPSPS
jgi:hypothetical protein